MANPHQTDAHLRLAHSILEQIMVSDFSKRRLSILLFILRLSWGCGKKEATIPRQSDFEIVGVGSGHVRGELDWLVESKVIYRNGDSYSFNKDYDDWRVSRAKEYRQAKVTELVRFNLNGRSQSKAKVTDSVTPVSKEVTETVTLGYRNGNKPMPKLATPKESIKESNNNSSSKKITINKEVMAEIALLYEGEIGKISQVAAEALTDAIKQYSADDIKNAIKEAVLRGKRNWKYIEGILKNKQTGGRKGERDYNNQGRYSHMVKR